MKKVSTFKEAQKKIEHFCAYQERCHEEVVSKLRSMNMTTDEIDQIMVHLITDNFLNEERFACSFARGKHRIKHWGKIRIINELKFKKISQTLITIALQEIKPEEYATTFHALSERHWETIREINILKKRKKFCDYLLRKGFESNLIFEKVKELEASISSN
ncbi:regulatory protein RecX [Flavobacterium cellulosilyticum]|uniref:Regulatory protein RecX n=1 Tax=Flavobacterium cellulosilyticum TaxID=2541731 RepID=A0A4R5CII8_9FLAO|nr:regulatory protein RecX [Flavobacterium cellulosilyticum]TDD99605.1 RecX family transcriptional regulator [Flavobacterium cellulosilyticum]